MEYFITVILPQVTAAMLGTVAFAVLFGVPGRFFGYCAVVGGAGWLSFLLCEGLMRKNFAIFIATVVVVFLSRIFAVRMKCPATIFLVTGIFTLVPGGDLYRMAYHSVMGELMAARVAGTAAIGAAVAIVLGIVVVFEIPQRFFGLPASGSCTKQ
ncbi:MAG: threonine/serine exporter family protein [Lachnospiraceae bacterium]|nr:threonine/serine exporter family protein [Lachnospiraceae bacterium]